ncbi:MAG: GMC family oxidoreductase N-terminal domain-containing protein [Parvularculaceae bacterium]
MAKNDAAAATGEFDYVVVGAGSAGCVIASRLSENPAVKVCLIEAGGPAANPLIHMPLGFALATYLPPSSTNWRFETVPQKGLNGRRGYQPRGRVLGGSSSINAMIYIRGTRSDYDMWARLGATGWSYDDVLHYFRKSEDQERGADIYHGAGGPLAVSDLRYKNPLSDLFLDAAAELQLPKNDDFNGKTQEGVGYYQVTQRNGRRCSSAAAFLEPARNRPNLAIITDAHAERILFHERRAKGVKFRRKGESEIVLAHREVILSAGAFQSPQLLMLSGIGPAGHVKEHGVDVVVDSPEVGENLQDHIDYSTIVNCGGPHGIGLNYSTIVGFLPALSAYRNRGEGYLTSNMAEAGGFLRTDPSLSEPDVQLIFLTVMVDDHGRKHHLGAGYSCHACVLRPKSRGTVRLASADPLAAPLIDPNFLADDDDLDRLKKGAQAVHRIFGAPALAARGGRRLYLEPGADDQALIEDIRNRADTIYHPVGTCRMGSDARAVLDPQLRVRGVERLRVADASIMPTLIGGNTNAPSIMIGEKAADLIKAA